MLLQVTRPPFHFPAKFIQFYSFSLFITGIIVFCILLTKDALTVPNEVRGSSGGGGQTALSRPDAKCLRGSNLNEKMLAAAWGTAKIALS